MESMRVGPTSEEGFFLQLFDQKQYVHLITHVSGNQSSSVGEMSGREVGETEDYIPQ